MKIKLQIEESVNAHFQIAAALAGIKIKCLNSESGIAEYECSFECPKQLWEAGKAFEAQKKKGVWSEGPMMDGRDVDPIKKGEIIFNNESPFFGREES